MEAQLIAKISESAEVDIPDVMVERQIDNILMDLEFSLYYQGYEFTELFGANQLHPWRILGHNIGNRHILQ